MQKIRHDLPGMLQRALPIAVTVAALLLAGCSDDETSASPPRVTSSSTAATTTTESSASSSADDATTTACRSIAEDRDLAQFWREVNNEPTVTGMLATRAGMAVMRLGRYTSDPKVAPAVSEAMSGAVTAMGDMNQEIAAGSTQFDIERFRGIITPVVTTCQDAGVDMAIPE